MYGIKITPGESGNVLEHRWQAMEFQTCERINVSEHTDYPGVRVYDLYSATTGTGEREPIDLEAAMAGKSEAMRILLSITMQDFVVVTSRIGYDQSREVEVTQKHHAATLPELNMFDFRFSTSSASLTETHRMRFGGFGGDIQYRLAPVEYDVAFCAIMANLEEARA